MVIVFAMVLKSSLSYDFDFGKNKRPVTTGLQTGDKALLETLMPEALF